MYNSPNIPRRVLIVDDDHFFTQLIVKMLAKIGISDVEIAVNGGEGFDRLSNLTLSKSTSPDLIILDINMPVMNGWELLEKLKNAEFFIKRPVPIVIVSTSKNEDDKQRAIGNSLVKDFVVKPLNPVKLKDIIGNCLEHSSE